MSVFDDLTEDEATPVNPYAPMDVEVDSDPGQLNPWTAIWLRPWATIRQVLDTNPVEGVIGLAAVGGAANMLRNCAMDSELRENLVAVLVLTLAVGPLSTIMVLYISGAMIGWAGRVLGGVGQSVHMRCALAWGSVPVIWTTPVWMLAIVLLNRLPAGPQYDTAFAGFMVIHIVLGIWIFFTVLKCEAEAHRISAWRAFAANMLIGLVILGIFLVIFLVIFATIMALAAANA